MIEEFTVARVGQPVTASQVMPGFCSLQVRGRDATPTSFSVALQGSNDGANWTTLLTHTNTDGRVVFAADAIPRPCRHFRLNCTAVDLGTAVKLVATAVLVPAA